MWFQPCWMMYLLRLVTSMLLPVKAESWAGLVPLVVAVLPSVVARLGWRCEGRLSAVLMDLSVNVGTAMQRGLGVATRRVPHARFVLRIMTRIPDNQLGQLSSLRCGLCVSGPH